MQKLPIVYHPRYNIGFWGLEKFHKFDSKKYGRVFDFLVSNKIITPDQVYEPSMISDEQLRLVHTQEYLNSLSDSATVALIAEMPLLSWMPGAVIERKVLDPMKYATGGTVLGADLAAQYGWAINLSGGYHHAKANEGSGFCIYADIPIAAYCLWQKKPEAKIMIVDLDAHQGNGNESIFNTEPRVKIFDMYNTEAFPWDDSAKKYIGYNYPLHARMSDEEYLAILKLELPKALDAEKPNFIIYNAGTDIFADDSVGNMKISAEGIIDRDIFVFMQARKRKIPILMVLSGGYASSSADIIGQSIANIIAFECGS